MGIANVYIRYVAAPSKGRPNRNGRSEAKFASSPNAFRHHLHCRGGAARRWRYVSPRIAEVLGVTPAEWIANPDLWRSRLHPEDRERVLNLEAEYARKAIRS